MSLAEPPPSVDGNAPPYTVSELAGALKRTLETNYGYVRLRGELSKVTRHASGHTYLSIKDERACIDGVIWKTVKGLKVRPEQGLEVIVTGRITTYPASSKYQIVVDSMEHAGVGALLAQLERLKAKLAGEGLFDPSRKRPPPRTPAVIGVITSPTGAVIRDILHRLRDRWPCRVVVWPVVVQGDAAAAQITAAIGGFCGGGAAPRPDVLIVARGGGSVEDLWPFNDETLARAVAACAIPLISAVGHETDTTLIDFVSDLRAPTPTAAAELATPVLADLRAAVADHGRRMARCTERALEIRRTRLESATRGLPRPDDLVAFAAQRLDLLAGRLAGARERNVAVHERRLVGATARLSPALLERPGLRAARTVGDLGLRLHRAAARGLTDEGRQLERLAQLLRSLSPDRPLERGFARVHRIDGTLVRSAAALAPGEPVSLRFADGAAGAVVDGGAPALARRSPRRAAAPVVQSELF